MMLVIGGTASGKRAFVRSLGYVEADFGDSLDDVVLTSLNCWVSEAMRSGMVERLLEEALQQACSAVVICTEVGCGIVPMAAEERAYREGVGRVSCLLAEKADVVYRLCAGIATRLK